MIVLIIISPVCINRADSIVRDAEMVRKTLVPKESFGGRYEGVMAFVECLGLCPEWQDLSCCNLSSIGRISL